MLQKTHHYTNGEITIAWKPDLCIHSGICARGLSEVFDPRRKPWIETDKATSQQLIDQVKNARAEH